MAEWKRVVAISRVGGDVEHSWIGSNVQRDNGASGDASSLRAEIFELYTLDCDWIRMADDNAVVGVVSAVVVEDHTNVGSTNWKGRRGAVDDSFVIAQPMDSCRPYKGMVVRFASVGERSVAITGSIVPRVMGDVERYLLSSDCMNHSRIYVSDIGLVVVENKREVTADWTGSVEAGSDVSVDASRLVECRDFALNPSSVNSGWNRAVVPAEDAAVGCVLNGELFQQSNVKSAVFVGWNEFWVEFNDGDGEVELWSNLLGSYFDWDLWDLWKNHANFAMLSLIPGTVPCSKGGAAG